MQNFSTLRVNFRVLHFLIIVSVTDLFMYVSVKIGGRPCSRKTKARIGWTNFLGNTCWTFISPGHAHSLCTRNRIFFFIFSSITRCAVHYAKLRPQCAQKRWQMTKKDCDKNHILIGKKFFKKCLFLNAATADTTESFSVNAKIRRDDLQGKTL